MTAPMVAKSMARFNKSVDQGYWSHLATNHQHRNHLAAGTATEKCKNQTENDDPSDRQSDPERVPADPLFADQDPTGPSRSSRDEAAEADEGLLTVEYEGDMDMRSPTPSIII